MFTGLIETQGKLKQKSQQGKHSILTLEPLKPSFLDDVKIGDSININGACQTVTQCDQSTFTVFTTQATLSLTNFNTLKQGDLLNLEKALQVGKRLDGHFVYGHIEAVGKVSSIKTVGESWLMSISFPVSLKPFLIKQGSVAINGVSLTIFDIQHHHSIFTVALIPETIKQTNLFTLKQGYSVNLESDPLAKYSYHQIQLSKDPESHLKNALINNGYNL